MTKDKNNYSLKGCVYDQRQRARKGKLKKSMCFVEAFPSDKMLLLLQIHRIIGPDNLEMKSIPWAYMAAPTQFDIMKTNLTQESVFFPIPIRILN